MRSGSRHECERPRTWHGPAGNIFGGSSTATRARFPLNNLPDGQGQGHGSLPFCVRVALKSDNSRGGIHDAQPTPSFFRFTTRKNMTATTTTVHAPSVHQRLGDSKIRNRKQLMGPSEALHGCYFHCGGYALHHCPVHADDTHARRLSDVSTGDFTSVTTVDIRASKASQPLPDVERTPKHTNNADQPYATNPRRARAFRVLVTWWHPKERPLLPPALLFPPL